MLSAVALAISASPAAAAPPEGKGGGKSSGGTCKKSCDTTSGGSETIDTASPTLAVATPSDGATVTGDVVISGSASDDVSVSAVDIAIDGGIWTRASGTTSWQWTWATAHLPNGTHTLTVRATDTSGNAQFVTRSVNVANASADTALPAVSISSPIDGATVSGTTSINGSATDASGIVRVEVAVDGQPWVSASGTTSWMWSWSTTTLPDGVHTVAVRATDGAGNVATTSRTYTVRNTTTTSTNAPDTQGTWTSPEGVSIDVRTAGPWTIKSVYEMLKAGSALDLDVLGPTLQIKVQDTYASQTVGATQGTNSTVTGYAAIIYLKGVDSGFSSRPNDVLHHEYGHAWSDYHLYVTHEGDVSSYLRARGIAGDPRLGSSYTWSTGEILADDYRLLFGSPASVSERPRHLNSDLPDPRDVTGLGEFLAGAWRGR